jgi:hypothetical protein
MSDDFVDRALAELVKDYPEHEELFAQVSGSTESSEEMLDELRNVLTSVSERDAIVERYAVIINNGAKRDVTAAITNLQSGSERPRCRQSSLRAMKHGYRVIWRVLYKVRLANEKLTNSSARAGIRRHQARSKLGVSGISCVGRLIMPRSVT